MGMIMSIKVVCLGANLESKIALERLVSNGAEIVGLVTLPSGNSSGVSDYFDLHDYAKSNEIFVIDTIDINSKETVASIKNLNADYLFVLGWSQLLKKSVLNSVKKFVVGSHPTPLPTRRGRAPIPWTILEEASASAVTLFRMSEKIDDGPILIQAPFYIDDNSYAMDVYLKAAEALAFSFYELYCKLNSNQIVAINEPTQAASYRGKRTPQDGFIDFSLSGADINRLIRAVSEPFPGAYFYYDDKRIVVWRCSPYEGYERIGPVGQIQTKHDGGIIVRAADCCVRLYNFESDGLNYSVDNFKVGEVLNFRLCDEVYELRKRILYLEGIVSKNFGSADV